MPEDKNSITRRLINDAGITDGMRVLDLGCGRGDVSFLLADAVGQTGEVVGIDRNANSLEFAQARRKRENRSNVVFREIDLSQPLVDLGRFDAVMARRVLMYLPKPAEILQRVLPLLNNNGIVAFLEIDATVQSLSSRPMPLHQSANAWIWDTVKSEGANTRMGFELPALLHSLGVEVKGVKAEANIQVQSAHAPLAELIRAILPRIVDHGVATEAEVDLSTLEDRLRDELSGGAVFAGDMVFTVWGRKTT